MNTRPRNRTAIALMLSFIAALSATQAAGIMPSLVSANSTQIPLTRALGSTEPINASGIVEVNDSGQLNLQLRQATPNSAYQAVFSSPSGNLQLGALTTDHKGEGQLQASLNSGAYVGIFELLRANSLQLVSASVTFNIGVTASTSTSASTIVSTQSSSQTESGSETQTATQTTSSETVSINNTEQVRFQVDPNFASLSAGAYTKFEIHIDSGKQASVLLVVRDLPPRSTVIFSQNTGTAGPEFHSSMTVLTSTDTPPNTYGLTVVAIVNGQEYDSQVALEVTASSTANTTTQTSSSISAPATPGLSITMTVSQPVYQLNSTVNLQGYVTDSSGSAVANANVVVQVDGPFGVEASSSGSITTDAAGTFQDSFQLPADAAIGTYTAFASTTKTGFAGATTHTTFVVGQSTTPSVNIQMVYVGDSSGNAATTFTAGSVVYVWVVVQNVGATFQGVLWIQIRDPNGIPVSIQIHISSLNSGETVKDGFGFTFLVKPTPGVYTVNALVSDKLISQGGTFLTSANTEFAVTD
jgi:hypothetical protein